jgi:methionyl aminopeptidase
MIVIKTLDEIADIRKSCELAASVLTFIEPKIKAGVRTTELNDLCHAYIVEHGAIPSPLNYNGFPKSICTSVNKVVCHGIPGDYELRDGDIVNVDITTFLGGFHGDTSKTFFVGKASRAARDLVKCAEESLWVGIKAARPGGHIGDIGEAIQSFVEAKGYSVVREYCGHGIGRKFHEDPHVVHVGKRGTGAEIRPGMVFTIEPMVNQGTHEIILLDDDWTVETADGKLSAQFEHTVAVLDDRIEVLTLPPTAK